MKENITLGKLVDRLKDICNSFTGEYNTKETRKRMTNRLTEELNKYVCTDIDSFESLGLVWNPRIEISEDNHTVKFSFFDKIDDYPFQL